jgi:membrane glycosyltransferase
MTDSRRGGLARHLHRPIYFSLVTLTTLGAMWLLSAAIQDGGVTPLELVLLLLYAVLMLWINASFWTAAIGFVRLLRRPDPPGESAEEAAAPMEEADVPFKTALVMPVYNEDPERVFAGLRAIWASLVETGRHQGFELFVLSDTRDPETGSRRRCTGAAGRTSWARLPGSSIATGWRTPPARAATWRTSAAAGGGATAT